LVFNSETASALFLGIQGCAVPDDDAGAANAAAAAAVYRRFDSACPAGGSDSNCWEATMATWIKCTNTKHEAVYINLDNAVTVTRNDVAGRITERGTVISFMGGEQVYIVVNEQPEEIVRPKS
jgi:hypothetical protein